jgi:hypothetical protein
MEERVRRLGGQFHMDSQLGRGTVIAAELPVVELNGTGTHLGSSSAPAPLPNGRAAINGFDGGAQKSERNGAAQRG